MATAIRASQPRRWHLEDLAIGLSLVLGVLLGLSGFNHFGAPWDEAEDFAYASASLAAYRTLSPDYSLLPRGDFVELHGPAYLMASELAASLWTSVRAGWSIADARHFNNHISFLVGLASLYLLTVRLAGRRAALGAFALMATQPLLLGHAFINEKDTPFMALFLASVAAGVLASSSSTGNHTPTPTGVHSVVQLGKAVWQAARQDWRSAPHTRRVHFGRTILVGALVAGGILVLFPSLPTAMQEIILRAHADESAPWINALFDLIATNAAQVAAWSYVEKAARIYSRILPLIVVMAWLPVFFAGRKVFPSLRFPLGLQWLWHGTGKPQLGSALAFGLAGTLLGITISIRSPGLFAGTLVTLEILRRRRPALPAILLYWGSAAIACYATWPFLWANPFNRFLDSLLAMAAYPWSGTVLYAGQSWDAGMTPWHYVPFLIAAQVTLPAILLAVIGLWRMARQVAFKRPEGGMDLALLMLWIGAPIGGAVVLRSVVYDNARQFLFAVPPLFILAGIGLDSLWPVVRIRTIRFVALIALLAPGILGIVALHPYEYIYYNSLVGGTEGAAGQYETDYWCTSLREAMEVPNALAPQGSIVAVGGPWITAREVARSDLVILGAWDAPDPTLAKVAFGVACTRTHSELGFYPEYPVVYRVVAGGATLAVVKDLQGSPSPP